MKNLKYKYLIAGTVLLIIGMSSFKSRGSNKHRHPQKVETYLIKKLDVSEKNAKRISFLLTQSEMEKQKIQLLKESLKQVMFNEFSSSEFRQDFIKNEQQKIWAKINESTEVLTKYLAEIHQMLNDDQRGQLIKKISDGKKNKHHSQWNQ